MSIDTIGCEAKAARREKHIELHDAIQRLDKIAMELDDLIYRMEGPAPQTGAVNDVEEATPNFFMDVLNGGADAISEKAEAAHKRIDRLNELLYG